VIRLPKYQKVTKRHDHRKILARIIYLKRKKVSFSDLSFDLSASIFFQWTPRRKICETQTANWALESFSTWVDQRGLKHLLESGAAAATSQVLLRCRQTAGCISSERKFRESQTRRAERSRWPWDPQLAKSGDMSFHETGSFLANLKYHRREVPNSRPLI